MISVCMTTFNGERYLKGQIGSILCQLSANDELIISDDGSVDGTTKIIDEINDKRIIFLEHKQQKKGWKYEKGYLCSQNFNNAIRYAKGDIIFLADQDDLWEYNKVEVFLGYLNAYDVVMSNISIIDSNDNIVEKYYFKYKPFSNSAINAVLTNPFFGCAMAFKKDVLKYILPIPKSCVSYDLWIGCIAQKIATVGFINEPLTKYRRHDRNISPATGRSANGLWFKLYWRLRFFIDILLRLMMLHQTGRCQ